MLLLLGASLSGCGGGGTPSPTSTGEEPVGGGAKPIYAGRAAYERECNQISKHYAKARIIYEGNTSMDLGDSTDVHAAVTLNTSLPPKEVLPRTNAVSGEPGLVVTCRLQARLSAPADEFNVDNRDWVENSFLGTDTVRWVWSVTPKLGGDHTLTVYVRPFVVQRPEGHLTEADLASEETTLEYTTRVHVNVPWNKRPEELMAQIASTLNAAEGLVKALTALIVAIVALLVAIPKLRRRKKKRAST
jgi:hypothetical protein